jgi:N,N-dimethylformamidase
MGYADRISVTPGQSVSFMVSSNLPTYDTTIVRLVHGDESPDGPGYKEEVVDTAANGRYPGRLQATHIGSYVHVDDSPPLRLAGSFTLQAWVYPTLPHGGRERGLISKWDAAANIGYGLYIGEDGDAVLRLGGGVGNVEVIGTGQSMKASRWYFVACTFDLESRNALVYQWPAPGWHSEEPAAVVERSVAMTAAWDNESPLLLAAGYLTEDGTGRQAAQGTYSGKLDSPRVYGKALDRDELAALARGAPPEDVGTPVAAWDFSAAAAGATVADVSGNELHGLTVNAPARAMTGHNWDGSEVDPRLAPKLYGAIHFHEDDLEDAGWEADFELEVPHDLTSGVYAAKLTAGGEEDFVPFCVRPAKGTATAPVLFLMPTLTYLAYANERTFRDFDASDLTDRPISLGPQDRRLDEHPELGLSLYDHHSDGSGCCYSSRLRPILNMNPKYRMWLTGAPRHFAADLYVTNFLEEHGYGYDVATDEDLHAERLELLAPYKVVLTGTHPEYYTADMLDALEAYLGQGGRLMYLGGNGFYWVTSVDPERPHMVEVRRGYAGTRIWESAPGEAHHSTTGEPGGLWRHRGRPPQRLVGVGFTSQGFNRGSGYRRRPDSFDPRVEFIFEGVGEHEVIGDFGLVMGGAAGDEIDHVDRARGTPDHALLLASSEGHDDHYQLVVEDLLMTLPGQGGTENPEVRADITFFDTSGGGAVFSVGSINWCGSLSHNGYDNNVARITKNVLERFLSSPQATTKRRSTNV